MLQIIIFGKDSCPFCTKAVRLAEKLVSEGAIRSYDYYKVKKLEDIPLVFSSHINSRTVPQVFVIKNPVEVVVEYIGGFTEMREKFVKKPQKSTKKTVFNANATGHLTGDYPLFLGEELGFADNINLQFPVLERLYDEQMAQIWNHAEIDLAQDRLDMKNVDPKITELVVLNLLWQTLADSVASRAIGDTILSHVTNSSLQDLYNAIILFETIHSKTYLHIIRQTLVDPNEALKQGYSDLKVLKRSTLLVDTFDALKNAADTSEENLRELILYCLVVLYLLESMNFMASFAVTFAVAELGVFQGVSQNVALIARDELLHARAGREVLNIVKQQWPETWARLQPRFAEMLKTVIDDEVLWADYLFSEGREMVGLNAKLLKEYVLYMAKPVANTLGVPQPANAPATNPLPYMDSYVDTSKNQIANQELQNGAYLLNSVKRSSAKEVEDLLANLREEFL